MDDTKSEGLFGNLIKRRVSRFEIDPTAPWRLNMSAQDGGSAYVRSGSEALRYMLAHIRKYWYTVPGGRVRARIRTAWRLEDWDVVVDQFNEQCPAHYITGQAVLFSEAPNHIPGVPG